MRNLVLGILLSIGGICLYFMGGNPAWPVREIVITAAGFIIFGFEVLYCSLEEHEPVQPYWDS